MTADELRKKFLKFFESKDHKIIASSSLIPETDQTVLFTTAGMQQFKPYFTGDKDATEDFGNKNLVSVQKCFRTSDIDLIGDESHLTFFEMLGNFSIGGYGKEEAIKYSWELMTSKDWYGLPKDKFFATVFAGDNEIPADGESEKFWKEVAKDIEVKKFGREENFWPNPVWVGTCGPSSELHYVMDDGSSIEVWNLVFTQYFHNEDGSFKDLGKINIDTGMGLERLAMISQGKSSVFETDLYSHIIAEIKKSKNNYDIRSERIIADHIKSAVFLIATGVKPLSRDDRGSIVQRLITNALTQENKQLEWEVLHQIIGTIILEYQAQYQELEERSSSLYHEIQNAGGSLYQRITGPIYNEFKTKLQEDFKLPSLKATHVGAGTIDYYHQSEGIPESVALGTAQEIGFDMQKLNPIYEEKAREHQEISRAGAGKFAGGLAGHSETEIKYHTATHLLHQALRDVLGPEVFQKGSNITSERLRFDFSFDRKMTDEEIKKVQDLINERIKEDLKVDHMIIPLDKAKEINAIGLFNEKYADKVSIYGVGPRIKLDDKAKDKRERGGYYSLEFCGGPHVKNTGVIGEIKIVKEEAISQGVRRIRVQLTGG